MLTPYVKVAVEGQSDQGMAKKIIKHSGFSLTQIVTKNGSGNIDKLIRSLSRTSPSNPWVVFRDSDAKCPVKLRRHLTKSDTANPAFLLRIVHPMTEGWLMADPQSFSEYFKIAAKTVPVDTELLPHAKRTLLALCSKSRNRDIRSDLVHPDGSAGPLYVSQINKFAEDYWDVAAAAQNSASLHRALVRLEELRSFLLTR